MCGIVGYIGTKPAREIVIKGLKRLEYRGYDSAGLAIVNGETKIFKCKGRVADLEEMVNQTDFNGSIGMGHTRWATHGEPNELNAHPQVSYKGNFVVVHNGIIENYALIKKHLQSRGIEFSSQTDTEVLANLIEHLYLEGDLTAEQAISLALNRVEGAYGLVIICTRETDRLFAVGDRHAGNIMTAFKQSFHRMDDFVRRNGRRCFNNIADCQSKVLAPADLLVFFGVRQSNMLALFLRHNRRRHLRSRQIKPLCIVDVQLQETH